MSSVVISGDTSGAITVAAPAVAGTNTITLPAVTGTVVVAGQNSAVTAGTAVASTSGTSIDFTGIPSWVKRITVMLQGVSTNGTGNPVIRIGDSGGLETTGYFSQTGVISGTNTTVLNSATGSWVIVSSNAANTISGVFQIVKLDGNTWIMNGTYTASTTNVGYVSGSKTLSDTLDRVSVVTSDTFDAGTINILFE